jgi:hypothetical protein
MCLLCVFIPVFKYQIYLRLPEIICKTTFLTKQDYYVLIHVSLLSHCLFPVLFLRD